MTTDNPDHDFDFAPTLEETLKQHCRLLEAELQEMGEELHVSRQKVATLAVMWSAVRSELSQAESEVDRLRAQIHERVSTQSNIDNVAQ